MLHWNHDCMVKQLDRCLNFLRRNPTYVCISVRSTGAECYFPTKHVTYIHQVPMLLDMHSRHRGCICMCQRGLLDDGASPGTHTFPIVVPALCYGSDNGCCFCLQDVYYEGILVPDNLDTPSGVANVLIQEAGKMKASQLKKGTQFHTYIQWRF